MKTEHLQVLKKCNTFRIYINKNVIFSVLCTCLAWFSQWNTLYFYHFIWDFAYVCYIDTYHAMVRLQIMFV